MEGTVGAPPQRVCPRCARISWATGPRCPYCRARFRHQASGTFAWMLALAVVVTLAGVAVMLLIAGHRFRDELNDRSAQIERRFDAQVAQLRQDVRNDIRAQPAATPVPTPSPTPSPSPSPTATATRTPRATATVTP
jgi:outer membrane murein-binding lipoprotein Lpp